MGIAIPGPCEIITLLILAAVIYGVVVTIRRRRVERERGFDVLPPTNESESKD